jgi:hypothetical protein
MIRDAIDKILQLATPNQIKAGDKTFVDKDMHVLTPPMVAAVRCSTLQGLADLVTAKLEDVAPGAELLVQIESPTQVSLVSRKSDGFGRRQVFATAEYPKGCSTFPFGTFQGVEQFIIAVQQSFQRVAIESDSGAMLQDLDYVIATASSISAESKVNQDDDGIAQKVSVMSGLVLKTEKQLRPRVNLAPYRTFAEIDQVLSQFIFRAANNNGHITLALFEGDGGRWRLAAVAAIKSWLSTKLTGIAIIG